MAEGAARHPKRSARRQLTRAQRIDWLRLIGSENVGPATFRDLLNHFGSAAAALEALPDMARRGGSAGQIEICSAQAAEAELERAEKLGAHVVVIGEEGYPPWLARVDVPPPLLYVRGKLALASRPIISIVGARNGSAIGQKFTRQLAAELGQAGYVIGSGLARGIDTAAHVAALERGTIAVMAGGIDVVYPPENADLHAAIAAQGMLLSERPMGLAPRARDFPRRNRLISGIAAGVVVVEAAQRSGSLITARMAGEQGREVFAVPGNPLDPRAAGTNRLIKEGATLVTGVEDIVQTLAPILGHDLPARDQGFDAAALPGPGDGPADIGTTEREKVLMALGAAPVDIDEIIRASGVPARCVHVVLLELDLAGRLERHGRQLVSLCSPAA
ncbi:MAG: DNA-protecting protein DprA [Alphaproteobacteria bacterium]|nr:MAG: DNA-protecting protein DprA [Alphaproteobacteria bacterium]